MIRKSVAIFMLLILLAMVPVSAWGALAITSTEGAGSAWVEVTAATATVGTTLTVSTGYQKTLLLEHGYTEAGDSTGAEYTVEISEDGANWVELTTVKSTLDATIATTDVNDADSTAGDAFLILTDCVTGEFDVVNRLWFVKDGTIANSEIVRTISVAALDTVTLAAVTAHTHADEVAVYDRACNWAIRIPPAVAKVRVICYNSDADVNCAFRYRSLELTAL